MAWASDGGSLVFVSGRGWEASLWRVEIVTGKPHRLAICNSVARVTAARNGETLAFERRLIDHNVWRGPGPAASDGGRRHALFRSPAWDLRPAYSPDGSRIAFMSARTGRWGVWTCTSDGTDCTEFTAPASMSVPQWSPDGRSIAVAGFRDEDPLDLYRLELASGFARRLTSDNAWESMPSWSRDGRWLYFSSNRTGAFELWKMPAVGGEGRQLTRQGGIAAHETADGRRIYFINRYPFGSLWRMPSDGGGETLVLDKRIHSDKWTLWQDRIVYVDEPPREEHRLVMFDPETGRTTHLGSIGKVPSAPGLAVSPDGKWILNAQTDQVSGDIMMVQNLK
jgi:Tol biopolymer transport system component